ncbi:hypothetical protein SAMN06272735_3006 [Streptomyces sp. TLI_55]|uniref:hypothetical protein n=1 Tax=Streptomyces sp. TLI_55 TaxID=1938861 RepID=UPI000BCB0E15|nr:hypothetical protein [Streptomyces sp. TLI_55]SNX58510.1 hypothetical protein SAMN06272735_3006 [Streptomyces sp. TLI_55]
MKLLLACWRAAVDIQSPLMVVQLLVGLVDDGFTWSNLGRELVTALLTWGTLSLLWAVLVWAWLRRRSRTAGLAFSAHVLDERQSHLLRSADLSDGWQQRIRDRLTSSDRAFLIAGKGPEIADKGQEEVRFLWRPGRRADDSVHGSLSFDAAAGTVRVDLREGERHLGVAGLRKGTSYVAMCQVARELELRGTAAG